MYYQHMRAWVSTTLLHLRKEKDQLMSELRTLGLLGQTFKGICCNWPLTWHCRLLLEPSCLPQTTVNARGSPPGDGTLEGEALAVLRRAVSSAAMDLLKPHLQQACQLPHLPFLQRVNIKSARWAWQTCFE